MATIIQSLIKKKLKKLKALDFLQFLKFEKTKRPWFFQLIKVQFTIIRMVLEC